ncbi:AAA family ATPase [Halorientalis salina]|uniref:AAA family ATPase n=1 Tax=Halorientalis salina TaxID=2932266 RepID=UPI0010AD3E6D|nr:MinD/ParA family protein [Halorientalis salina]
MPGTVYAVAGSKGGVGKTTTAANLAATLRATGRSVVLVDTDLAMSNLKDVIGLTGEATIHDVLAGECSVQDAIIEESEDVLDTPGKLDVLPGATELDAFATAEPEALTGIVEDLADRYDTVILDTASGITRETAIPIAAADETIVMTTPLRASVLDAAKTVEFVESVGGTVGGLVVSRHAPGLDDEEIVEQVGVDRLATIPDLDAPGVDPLRPYRTLVVRLLIGRDVATDPANVLDIDEGETPRITSTLEPVPESAAGGDAPEDVPTVDDVNADSPDESERTADEDAEPASAESAATGDSDDEDDEAIPVESESKKDGTIHRFVNAISGQGS